MSLSGITITQQLKKELATLTQETDSITLALETLQQRVQDLEKKINEITLANGPSEVLGDCNTQLKDTNEKIHFLQQTMQEKKEKSKQIDLKLIEIHFQEKVSELWNQETSYRKILEESGKTTSELLFEKQNYKLKDIKLSTFVQCMIADYARLGRSDIVSLFQNLENPLDHESIFKMANEKYTETKDHAYGLVLSTCYSNGYGTEEDSKKGFEINKILMKEGSVLAMCSVANEEDIKKHHEYYLHAIKQQEFYTPHCMWGYRLLHGAPEIDIEKNIEQGKALLDVAAKNKQWVAAETLALYFWGQIQIQKGLDKISSQRVYHHYAKLAADLQSPYGMYLFAVSYSSTGIDQINYQKYFGLLYKSAELGEPEACRQLAVNYTSGIYRLQTADLKKGLSFAFQAIRRDISQLKDYEIFFEQNKHNLEFMVFAYDLFLQCLEGHLLDNTLDSVVIGTFYKKGILVPKDIDRAIACFKKAAEQEASLPVTHVVANALGSMVEYEPSLTLCQFIEDVDASDVRASLEVVQSNFIPFFNEIKKNFTWIPEGEHREIQMPNDISLIVADYAFEIPGTTESHKEKTLTTSAQRV